MNTTQTNFLYNLIFDKTNYESNGNFLGNKAFVRKNNKLAQIEFLKGNKIGDSNLRDLVIKVKLKSASANDEEIETSMSFYDETFRNFLISYDELNNVISSDVYDNLMDIFCFNGKDDMNELLCAEMYCNGVLGQDISINRLSQNEIAEYCLKHYFHEIGNDIASFLDFMFE